MKKDFTIATLTLLIVVGSSEATLIDLNTFIADPFGAADVASDGSSATIYEDPSVMNVFFYDSSISIPMDSMYLTFDYVFAEGFENDDDVNIYLYDPVDSARITRLRDADNDPFEVFLYSSGSGSVTWDLLGADFLGDSVGFEVDLNSWDLYTDSYVEVSNVNITPIPEPGTILLLTTGLAGIAGYGIRRRKKWKSWYGSRSG
jgi:hypothetical protein